MSDDQAASPRHAYLATAMAEAHRESPRMVDLRKWAIERLLQTPGAEALMRPGWIHEPGEVTECDGPGGPVFTAPHLTRVEPRLFDIADDLVRYAETGEHPKPEEPGA